jgi:hypothetical protein
VRLEVQQLFLDNNCLATTIVKWMTTSVFPPRRESMSIHWLIGELANLSVIAGDCEHRVFVTVRSIRAVGMHPRK